jgi:hypothetical protein
MGWFKGWALRSYDGTMPICIVRESGNVDIVEKSLNRHDNHSGICGPVLRNMAVGIRSGWASNIGGCIQ